MMNAYLLARENLEQALKRLDRQKRDRNPLSDLILAAERDVFVGRELVEALGRVLPDGTYRLTEDVKNPKPDRRMTHSFRHAEIWKAGTKVFLRTHHNRHGVDVRSIGPRSGSVEDFEDELFPLLYVKLEAIKESPSDWIERTYATDAANILDKLCETGVITMEQVEQASAQCNSDYEREADERAEQEAERAREDRAEQEAERAREDDS